MTEPDYPWTAPHFGPLGHVAVLAAHLEQIAGWIFGLLLDTDDARIGDIVGSPLPLAQVLDRTRQLAAVRLDNMTSVDRWVSVAKDASEQRNRLLHSAFEPSFDHATQTRTLSRQRLRGGRWDVDLDFDIGEIRRTAERLMEANAAGSNAYIVIARTLMGHP